MGTPNRPRAPLESSADEVPTQILSQKPGEEYGDDDGNTIEHRDEPTIRADVETEELRAKAPPLAISQPKVPRPAVYAGPENNEFLEAIEPLEGDNTEVGNVARLVAIAAPPEREDHTAIMPAPPLKAPGLGKSMPTPPMAMAPIPIPAPSSSARAGALEDDPPYEVPGLEPRSRGKWIGAAALLIVLVGIGGIAVGRLSAKGVAPTASSAAAMVTVVPTETAETRDTIPPPAPTEDDSAKAAAPVPSPAPAPPPAPAPVAAAPVTHVQAPVAAPRPHAAPHPAPAPRPHGSPTGVIVRDSPF